MYGCIADITWAGVYVAIADAVVVADSITAIKIKYVLPLIMFYPSTSLGFNEPINKVFYKF